MLNVCTAIGGSVEHQNAVLHGGYNAHSVVSWGAHVGSLTTVALGP
jgi:hypothetical protein